MLKKHIVSLCSLVAAFVVLAAQTGCSDGIAGPQNETARLESAGPGDKRKLDLNRDGRINASDLVYFAWATRADVTGDQRVDDDDRAYVGAMLGQSYPEDLAGMSASELAWVARVQAADFNEDHAVTQSDFVFYAMLEPMAQRADVNHDGYVDSRDLGEIERNLGHEIEPS